jgi:hypothetical protein
MQDVSFCFVMRCWLFWMRTWELTIFGVGLVRKDMSVAQWDAVRGTAEVVVKKGKAWTATGFTRGSQHLAFIEEVV